MRGWYFASAQWLASSNPAGDAKPGSQASQVKALAAPVVEPNCSAGIKLSAHCAVCGGELKKFWNDDEEEWQFRGAVHSSKDDLFYHFRCHQEQAVRNILYHEA